MMILGNLLTPIANKQQKNPFASVMNGLQSTEASSWNYCMLVLDWTGNWEGDDIRPFISLVSYHFGRWLYTKMSERFQSLPQRPRDCCKLHYMDSYPPFYQGDATGLPRCLQGLHRDSDRQ